MVAEALEDSVNETSTVLLVVSVDAVDAKVETGVSVVVDTDDSVVVGTAKDVVLE